MAEKAEIHILDSNGSSVKEKIQAMFNPTEYSFSTKAEVSGTGKNIQFKKVTVDDFKVTLFFDTYEKTGDEQDVRKQIEKIAALVVPTVEGKETKQPPLCLFCWGNFAYKGIIHQVDQKFTMFVSTGIPVRAQVSVSFKSVITSEEDAKMKGKEACRKLWIVKAGDRLDLIAHAMLRDVNQWRKIAELNDISDPMIFPTDDDIGKTIIIPDIY